MSMAKLDEIARRNIRDKPCHLKVAVVNFEQEGCVWRNGAFVVTNLGPVCGTDFNQLSTALGHHIRHAKRATDLDKLPTRDDDLLPPGEPGQRQQHGCGIVCDSEGSLGTRHTHQKGLHMLWPHASMPGLPNELQ